MFRRRSHTSFRRSGKKRRLEWGRSIAFGGPDETVPAGSTSGFTWWYKVPSGVLNTEAPPDGAREPDDWTLVRTLWNYQAVWRPGAVGFFNVIFAVGLIVWEGNTDDVPSFLDVPQPVDNAEADWIAHSATAFATGQGGFAAGDAFYGSNGGADLFAQSRAMRKLSSRQGILGVAEWNNEASPAGSNILADANVMFIGRSLFKLP